MSTPIPRTSSAIIASGFQAVPEGFRAFAGILERELTALTTERDELRAELATERARLDWLLLDVVSRFDDAYYNRAAIDAAIKEVAK